jgi:predicted O-methyltransferase YrrM
MFKNVMSAMKSIAGKSAGLRPVARSVARKLPGIGPLIEEHEQLQRDCGFVRPGHFYSPIPPWAEIKRDADRIFAPPSSREIPGIDLREAEQLDLLKEFSRYYADQPFTAQKKAGNRYFFDNPAYSYSDALMLHCMLRHARPKRIIEVGSGYSTCVTLDTSEQFLGGSLQVTLVEPYPELLHSLITPEDKKHITILASRLQAVDLAVFDQLEKNDILFIDSTHVVRVDSDVNRVFFDILPRLAPGVLIHFHDAFFPFEYPRQWLFDGMAWSELYLLRAFLQYNNRFRIVLMNTFMERFHEAFFREHMPLCLENPGGSIWLEKLSA